MSRIVVVTGSRNWECFDLAVRVLGGMVAKGGDIELHHGDARGVDRSFQKAARFLNIPEFGHPAAWEDLGRRAGPVRNQAMIDLKPEFVVACHPELDKRGGTFDCVCRALSAGIRVYHIRGVDTKPLRVESLEPGKITYTTSGAQ